VSCGFALTVAVNTEGILRVRLHYPTALSEADPADFLTNSCRGRQRFAMPFHLVGAEEFRP